jgi:site-specific DNA recombinase
MEAAIYARVSTERQDLQQTIESQIAILTAWVRQQGYHLAEEHRYCDRGYSGARLDRPALDRLRDDAQAGAFSLVAILTPDRLARKYAYQALLLDELRRSGCQVVFVQHPISDNPNDQLLLQIQAAVAEYERAVLGERFRRGKLHKARAGRYVANVAAYGYRYVRKQDGADGHLVVDETEAALVRMLYAWLVDERMTVRQITKRLNAGPWRPRNGRPSWSTSVVHHILSDPVYTGTAYANRYQYVPAIKPRRRDGARAGGPACRRLKPPDDWIAIPVPALVDQDLAERARAQLARNATLSFRHNTKHAYLLRCLLTCGRCGLAMFGTTHPATPRQAERRYYKCHGKDPIDSARGRICTRRTVTCADLEDAVWGHVVALLQQPERLLAQVEHHARLATEGNEQERAEAQRLAARLDRLGREDRRLVDAYQAGVVTLAELTERRQQLELRRRAIEDQREQHARLRRERAQAKAVLTDLTAFCERVRGRLARATFADRQAILQLLIERIIVHDDALEIRHVIPLRHPEDGPSATGPPDVRLRSDGMDPAPLPARADEHLADGLLQALVGVADHELDAPHAAGDEVLEERAPERHVLAQPDVQPEHLADAVGPHPVGDDHGHRHHPAVLPDVLVAGVQPQVRGRRVQPPGPERRHLRVQAGGQAAHLALREPGDPQRLDQRLHLPGAHALHVRLGHDRHQRLLRAPARLEPAGEVAARPQLRDRQLQRPHPRVPGTPPVPVPLRHPLLGPLVPLGPDLRAHLGVHQLLDDPLHHRPQPVPAGLLALAHALRERHPLLGHRAPLSRFGLTPSWKAHGGLFVKPESPPRPGTLSAITQQAVS